MTSMQTIEILTGPRANAQRSARQRAWAIRLIWMCICMLCFAALAIACTACGPAFTDEDKAAFTGRWELVSFGVAPELKSKSDASKEKADAENSDADAGANADNADSEQAAEPEESEEEKAAKEKQLSTFDVLLYKEWGLISDLTLADDGTCVFNFYGDLYQGTWKMESKTEASIELVVQNEGKPQKESYDLVMKDGLLWMTVQDMPVVFQKRELPKESEEG